MSIIDEISASLRKGRAPVLCELVEKALGEGDSAEKILNEGLISVMSEIGVAFGKGEIFIPEVMRSARAFNAALEKIKPVLVADGSEMKGVAVIGTVKSDNHDIGKNLVSIMLQGAGIKVIDLGSNVESERFVSACEENNADILAMSALLTTTMPEQGKVIKLLEERGLRERVYVMVGGAPVTPEFAADIGADCYTPDAGSAAAAAAEYLEKKKREA